MATFQRQAPTTEPAEHLPVAELSRRLAVELASAAALCRDCEHLAGDLAKGGATLENLTCQTAFKTDPRSASNIDPSSLCSRTGGEARSGQLAQRVAA